MLRRWPVRHLTSVARSRICRKTTELRQPLRLCSRPFHLSATNHADITPLRKQLKDIKKQNRGSNQGAQNAVISEKDDRLKEWELTVGIEIHAQLNTSSKLFSRKDVHPL